MQTPILETAPPVQGPCRDAPNSQRLDRPAFRAFSARGWVMLGLLAGLLLTAVSVAALVLSLPPADVGHVGPFRYWYGGGFVEVIAEDELPALVLPVRIALDPLP
jgi:hypothetical protein